ncbi:MAG: TetR/AcrR family transcriptional regulator, partial [Paracoccaceae bacterium]
IAEGGPGRLTMEAVAARSGVGKPTIYRHWANAQELAMAALMEAPSAPAPVSAAQAAPASPLAALGALLEETARRLASRQGRQMAVMLASAEQDGELFKAFRNHVLLDGRRRGRALLFAAVEAGEARRDLDHELALDMVFGAIFMRVLLSHAPLEEGVGVGALGLLTSGAGAGRFD